VSSTAGAATAFTTIGVEGQTITLTTDSPDGEFWVQMVVTGDDFIGEWETNSFGGELTGKRRRS